MIRHLRGTPARYASLAAILLLFISSVANATDGASSQEFKASDIDKEAQLPPTKPTPESSAPKGEPIQTAQYTPTQPLPVIVSETPVTNPYARFSKYMVKGWNVTMPDPSNYIDQDPYGIRTAMEEDGLFFFGFTNDTFTYDANGNVLTKTGLTNRTQLATWMAQLHH